MPSSPSIPKLPANQNITDLKLAPRNEAGLVEFQADVVVYKPRDSKRGNGTALIDIPNRGGETWGSFQRDDSFLFMQGFTVVDIGWQFDVPEKAGNLRAYVPTREGRYRLGSWAVHTGRAGDVVPGVGSQSLGVPGHRAAVGEAVSSRERPESEPKLIPREAWSFSDATHVEYKAGFVPGRIYEVVYKAENPAVVGLGPAAVRDFVSFLKYGGGNATALFSDQSWYLKRTIAFGVSQSGRFLRTFLYDGFNGDEKGRKVFDGVMAHVAWRRPRELQYPLRPAVARWPSRS